MTIKTDFYTDPMCIWALVAEPKVALLKDEFGDALQLEHHVLPLFGSIEERLATGSWAKGGIPGRVAATARVAAAAGVEGVSGKGWEHSPSSSWGPSMTALAVRHLEDAGTLPAGSTGRTLYAMRQAFFVEDRDITLRSEQQAVLARCDLPVHEVFALVDDGRAMARLSEARDRRDGLRLDGSPTWVFDGGRAKLYGNVDMRVLRATVQALVDGDAPGRSVC
ncbi:MAG: hypothetical protein KDA24_29170 [Deltaproteobacteria bacterium]|nr:hypothetical protein [Deltaproteobacteria bacterium]